MLTTDTNLIIEHVTKGYLLTALRDSDLLARVLDAEKLPASAWILHPENGRAKARKQVEAWLWPNLQLLCRYGDSQEYWESVGKDLWQVRNGTHFGFRATDWEETPRETEGRNRLRDSAFAAGIVTVLVSDQGIELSDPVQQELDPPGSRLG